MIEELDIAGKFIMKNFRDNALSKLDALLKGEVKAPGLLALQISIGSLGPEEKGILKKACIESFDSGLHDLLFALQEATYNNEDIKLLVNGKNVAELCDGLQGELFTEDGWFSKFSAYGEIGE
jgi:hypothetical protein